MNGKQGVALALTVIIAVGIFMFYSNKISDLEFQPGVTEFEAYRTGQPSSYQIQTYIERAGQERLYLSGGVLIIGLFSTVLLRTKKKREA